MGTNALRLVEFALWVAAASAVITVVVGFLGFLAGDDLVAAKYALFVVGTLLFGLGSFAIQPSSPQQDEKRVSVEGDRELRFETVIQDIPPLRGRQLPFEQRISRNTKLFVTSLVVLAVTLVMEFVLGIRV